MKEDIQYILYGAGERGINALYFLGRERVRFFCDAKLSGTEIEGKSVINPSNLKKIISDNDKVVITTVKPKNVIEISNLLNSIGVEYVLFEDAAKLYLEKDAGLYDSLNKRWSFNYRKDREYYISWDRCNAAGSVSSYMWQDLWAAKRIHKNPVDIHYDIGSRLDGFITHLISFGQRVCMIDIRPLEVKINGMDFIKADATELSSIEDNSISSLSALCSIEHFGLGRFGDPINPESCFRCFEVIQQKMRKNGNLYLSVPIGEECVCFNAHRVFNIKTILDSFCEMELIELSTCFQTEYMENITDYHEFDDWYDHEGDRMGLFWFRKK